MKAIKNDPNGTEMTEMCNILIAHAQSTNALIQFTAIDWIREFVQLSGPKMLPFASGIFTAILPCLAYEGDSRKDIKKCAQEVDKNMLELISSKDQKEVAFKNLELDSVMKVLEQYLIQGSVDTRVAVLKWIHHLFTQAEKEVKRVVVPSEVVVLKETPFQMSNHAVNLYPVLFETLSDLSDEVVLKGLTVLAEIVNSTHSKGNPALRVNRLWLKHAFLVDSGANQVHYRNFLVRLLKLFEEKRVLLENRGAFIISRLCTLLNAEIIYRIFSELIHEETPNLRFASTMVRTLNTILLTTSELFELRMLLKDISDEVRQMTTNFLQSSNLNVILPEVCIPVQMPVQIVGSLSSVNIIFVPSSAMLSTCFGTGDLIVSEIDLITISI